MSTATRPARAPEQPGPRPISGTVFVLACVTAAAAFVAFLVFVSPMLLARTQAAAPPPAPEEIASGEVAGQRFTATAVEQAFEEPCLELEVTGTGGSRACTERRGEAVRAVGGLDVAGTPLVYGIVDARTALVRLELAGGEPLEVEPSYVDFGFPLGFFAVPLEPGARLLAVTGLDRSGDERGRAQCAHDGATVDC